MKLLAHNMCSFPHDGWLGDSAKGTAEFFYRTRKQKIPHFLNLLLVVGSSFSVVRYSVILQYRCAFAW
jgi:hypothetical protein